MVRHTARGERQLHILLHGEPREQRKGLEHDGGVGIYALYRLATIQDLSFCRPLEPGDDAQQRALAAPCWPKQRHEFALVNPEIDILKGDEAVRIGPIELADMVELQQRGRLTHGLLQPSWRSALASCRSLGIALAPAITYYSTDERLPP
jgi:hypothetical protein